MSVKVERDENGHFRISTQLANAVIVAVLIAVLGASASIVAWWGIFSGWKATVDVRMQQMLDIAHLLGPEGPQILPKARIELDEHMKRMDRMDLQIKSLTEELKQQQRDNRIQFEPRKPWRDPRGA